MTTGRRTKQNNAGFSLLELIVVVLVLGILAGGMAVGISVVYNARSDSAAKKLYSMFTTARETAMAYSDGETWITIIEKDNDLYAGIYVKETGITELKAEEKLGSNRITVELKASDQYVGGTTETSYKKVTTEGISIYYNSANGGLRGQTAELKKPSEGAEGNYYLTDIKVSGSETIEYIVIPETGRVLKNE
ncbi:MAG: prepilin-type N-terminal cleavage/methylation domain-containing protein [Lachnospiraceae bacterium]|nr:prepilin-type N-terminal cleavage/methylation domain-containing protein [Lachnospiraceae bacterium]